MNRRKTVSTVTLLLCGMTLMGCQGQLLSDQRIAADTAPRLGVMPEDVVISHRSSSGFNTSYIATTREGSWTCMINGGSILAPGMTIPMGCTPMVSAAPTAAHRSRSAHHTSAATTPSADVSPISFLLGQ